MTTVKMVTIAQVQNVVDGLIRMRGRRDIVGLKPTETRVMCMLYERSPLTHAELTFALRSDKAQISRAVQTLMKKGYVIFAPTARHKRQRLLYLSPLGTETVESVNHDGDGTLARALSGLSYEETRALSTLAQYFRDEEPYPSTVSGQFDVSHCTAEDLAWLLSQKDRYGRDAQACLDLSRRAVDLATHIQQSAETHRWIVRDWSLRIGGCVLTPDLEAPENAWIRLLVLPSDKDAARMLLRECIAAAQEQTYELVRFQGQGSNLHQREVLSELGFHPADPRDFILRSGDEVLWVLRVHHS